MDNVPAYVTSPEDALSRAVNVEEALLAAADGALAEFLDLVLADALDGDLLRGSVVGYWQATLGRRLAHPSFANIRDELIAALGASQLADDAYTAGVLAIETAHNMGATDEERSQLLNTLFTHPSPSLIASLSDRVNKWLTRRVQRYLRMRVEESGLEALDFEGPLFQLPPTKAGSAVEAKTVGSQEWLEGEWSNDDRPSNINWRARMRRDIQTAYTKVFGANMQRMIEKYGFTAKQWITRRDDHVRHTHIAADNDVVPLYETFTVGGFPLRYPGDPLGPAKEVMQCRCVIIAAGERTVL